MTHKHNLDEFTPWKVDSYELHEGYTHGDPPTEGEQPPIAVGQFPRGPDAIVLERALFLNGYTRLLTAPDDDQDLDAPRADDGRTGLDIPQVSLLDTRITLPDGQRAHEGGQWPARAERIEIDTVWEPEREGEPQDVDHRPRVRAHGHQQPPVRVPVRHPGLGAGGPAAGAREVDPRRLQRRRPLRAGRRGTRRAPGDRQGGGRHRRARLDGWLTAVSRLVEDRLLCCLQADVQPADGTRILLHDQSTKPIKTERYSRRDPLRKAIDTGPGPARERANRLRYEGGPFHGHRGILLGTPVTPHSKLWRTLVEMYDERFGRPLWEPESPVHGRVMGLDPKLGGMAAEAGIKNGRHGVIWAHETRPLPSPTHPSHGATTAAEPDEPGSVIVHILSAVEHDKLRKRVLGPFLQAVVDHEAERGEHTAEHGHPVRELLAECKARRKTTLAGG